MQKRAIGKKDHRPALVRGAALLLALLFAAVAVKSQFFNASVRPADNEAKAEPAGAINGIVRKNIYDRNFMDLAVTFQRSSIYARPLELESPEKMAAEVARILEQDEETLLASLRGERSFVWLGQDIAREKAARIADLNFKGVYRINQVQRFYPNNQLAAHVLGFLKEEQGLAGVEFYYDGILRGGGGHEQKLAAAGADKRLADGSESANLVLTIDSQVQQRLEQKLKALAESTGAKAGVAVMMTPDTGEILALANLPDYDPNRFWEFSDEARRNRAMESSLSLGAMEAVFQLAARMEKKLAAGPEEVGPDEAGPGPGGEKQGIIQKTSWNQVQPGRFISAEGVDFAQVPAAAPELKALMTRVGLTGKSEIDLPAAMSGLKDAGAGKPEAVSFGPAASPLALLSAFCRLFNGGRDVSPHVLRAVWQGSQVWSVPASPGAAGAFALRADLSEAIRAEMARMAGAGRTELIIESLLQKEAEIQERPEPEKAEEKEPEAKKKGNKGVVEPAILLSMDSILLGAAPLAQPEVAIIVALEGGRFDIKARSPVRNLAEEMLPQARTALQKNVKAPSAWEVAIREVGYHKKMEKGQAKSPLAEALAKGTGSLVMPDLHGLSARKAMQAMQAYGLRIKLAGSGMVAGQKPQAGTPLQGVEQCALQLKPGMQ